MADSDLAARIEEIERESSEARLKLALLWPVVTLLIRTHPRASELRVALRNACEEALLQSEEWAFDEGTNPELSAKVRGQLTALLDDLFSEG